MKNPLPIISRSAFITALFGTSMLFSFGANAADAEAGKAIAESTCAACHNADGNSTLPLNPKLAGQVPGYIATQLAAFKSGARESVIMAGMAAPLSKQDMENVDAFYTTQITVAASIPEDQMESAKAGAQLYRGGFKKHRIAACMSCHGPNGIGIPTRYPRVAGQHPEYLEQQLLAFKTNQRKHDVMHPIAFKMSEQQIKDVSLFMSGLK